MAVNKPFLGTLEVHYSLYNIQIKHQPRLELQYSPNIIYRFSPDYHRLVIELPHSLIGTLSTVFSDVIL